MARKKGSEAVIATEQQGNGLGMAVRAGEGVAPYFMMDVEVHGPTGLRWRDGISHNSVVDRGAEYALNRVFGFETASTQCSSTAIVSLFNQSETAGITSTRWTSTATR